MTINVNKNLEKYCIEKAIELGFTVDEFVNYNLYLHIRISEENNKKIVNERLLRLV